MVFRSLLRHWLGGVAGQRVRQQVLHTAREKLVEAAEAPEEEPTPQRRPCDVAVVFALGIEAGGTEDLLEGAVGIRGYGFAVRQGGLNGRHVVVVRSGAGHQAARHATEAILDGHRPQWIISAGFAGGLRPEVARHDLVMADCLIDAAGHRLVVDLKVDPQSLAQTPGVHVGPLVTVDRVVRLPEEKRALGDRHEALAVDMESYAVAEVCREHEVRFLAIRIISDAVDDELPRDIEALLAQKTRVAKLGAVVGAVWRRPSSVKDLWKLKEDALVASDRLAKFLASTIEQLVPLPPAAT
jgi:adenosylhomocysteine nucleosidase